MSIQRRVRSAKKKNTITDIADTAPAMFLWK